MKEYFVEVFLPPYPAKGRKVVVHDRYPGDSLSATLTHLFVVRANDKQDALALTLAGMANTLLSPGARQLKMIG